MRQRAKVDANQAAIVEALRSVGWRVASLASHGRGMPDLLIQRGYDTKLIEVKSDKGKLTADQVRFIDQEGWHVQIVRTVEEALSL